MCGCTFGNNNKRHGWAAQPANKQTQTKQRQQCEKKGSEWGWGGLGGIRMTGRLAYPSVAQCRSLNGRRTTVMEQGWRENTQPRSQMNGLGVSNQLPPGLLGQIDMKCLHAFKIQPCGWFYYTKVSLTSSQRHGYMRRWVGGWVVHARDSIWFGISNTNR